jgi:hypothetical protein
VTWWYAFAAAPYHPDLMVRALAASWRWVGLRRLPYHGTEISFFATREDQGDGAAWFHIYATTEVATDYSRAVYREGVTVRVRVLNPDVCHIALRRSGEVVLLIGNTSAGSSIVPIELGDVLAPEQAYEVRLYDSEGQTWRSGDPDRGMR